ncbi:MAG: hypothetical protein KF703_04510 [Actinobacteria bacterium]|nr:hypothetical protein [Actinomycetota bacterium]
MTRTKLLGTTLAMGVVAVLLAACKPTFPAGSTLATSGLGPLVTITWPTIDVDTDKVVTEYRIDVDGSEIARVSAATRSCVVVGLPKGTTSTISVTAYDSAAQWSGDQATGIISATYAPPSTGSGSGTAKSCVPTTDTDGDRLPNAVETNGGTYQHAGATASNPNLADTDGDGIKDGDEVLGTTAGLDLPAMGANPVKKNLAMEFDWFDDNAEPGTCSAHSHRPTAGMIAKVATAYSTAPVSNPDGTTGISLIADYGQGGAFTGGNLIADADGVIAGGVGGTDFTAYKSANFASNRAGIFHYVLMPHRYNTTSTSSGQAEINGNDMIVSLYCYGSDQNVANTVVHENGHNLGLRHGGNVDTNYKPNYNSVMNYQYQFPGIDTNCTVPGDGLLSYSVGARASLNENALIETDGICSGVDVDWNANSVIDAAAVSVDINQDGGKSVLSDYNDWANINLAAVTNAGASPFGPEVVTEQPVPVSAQG